MVSCDLIIKIIWCSSSGVHKEAIQTKKKKEEGEEEEERKKKKKKEKQKSCFLLAIEESKESLASDSGGISCWFLNSWTFPPWLGVADIPIGFFLPTEIKILKDAIPHNCFFLLRKLTICSTMQALVLLLFPFRCLIKSFYSVLHGYQKMIFYS